MRLRYLVSSAALAGALLASSSLVTDALAQKGAFMTPSTSWAVSKVDSETNPYCALAKKFNQDTVLTVARNSTSQTSFALDFQQPVFSSGQSVKIMLDPGAGQQRAYDIKPVSSKAFVVRLGRDGSFFDALERTGMLRVELNGQSYHFNMADIDDGQSKLDACVASSILPAAGDEVEPSLTISPQPIQAQAADNDAAIATATKSFRAEINSLRKKIKGLEEQNSVLRTKMNTRDSGVSEVSSSVTQLSNRLREVEDENVILKQQLADSRNVTPSAAVTQSSAEDRARIAELQAQLSKAEEENRTLREASSQQQSLQTAQQGESEKELAELKASTAVDIAALEAEIERLLDTQKAKDSEIAAMGQQIKTIETLRSEKQALQDELAASLRVVDELKSEKETLVAEAQNSELSQKQVSAEGSERIESLEGQLAALESSKKGLEDEVTGLQSLIEEARVENERLEGLLQEKESVAANADDIKAQLSSLQSENDALKTQIQTFETLQKKNEDALASKEQQIVELQQQFESETSDDAQYQQKLAALEAQQEKLKTSLADVVKVADALKKDNEDKEQQISSLESEKQKLENAQKDLEKSIEDMRGELKLAEERIQNAQENVQTASVEKPAEQKPVKSVVLGDVAATTAPSVVSAMQAKPQVSEAQPKAQPEPAPKVVEKIRKPAPVPPIKPQNIQRAAPVVLAAAQKPVAERVEQEGAAVVEDVVQQASSANDNLRKIDAAMAVIEEEMRNTAEDDKARMEQLAQQYAYLSSQRDYLSQQETEVAELVPDEAQSATEVAAEDVVNEAQRYEQSLKSAEAVIVEEQTDAPEVQEVVEWQEAPQSISVSSSADPFEGISVEGEGEGVETAQAAENALIAEVEQPVLQRPTPQETVDVASNVAVGAQDVSITELVTAARVTSSDKVKRVEKGAGAYYVAYQWNGGEVYGSAEQKALSSPSQFDSLVQDYLERTESRCPGEFAIVPDSSVGGGDARTDSYEVACVSNNVSSGASLLFFNKGGTFTIVAHEAPAEELGNAINMRNQVRRVVTGG